MIYFAILLLYLLSITLVCVILLLITKYTVW